jgi:hypothetical protein
MQNFAQLPALAQPLVRKFGGNCGAYLPEIAGESY